MSRFAIFFERSLKERFRNMGKVWTVDAAIALNLNFLPELDSTDWFHAGFGEITFLR